jgi:hypothetical protein
MSAWETLAAWMAREDLDAEAPSPPPSADPLHGVLELRLEDAPRHSFFFAHRDAQVVPLEGPADLETLPLQTAVWTEDDLLLAHRKMERAMPETHPRDAATVHGVLCEALGDRLTLAGDEGWREVLTHSPLAARARQLLENRGIPLPAPSNSLWLLLVDETARAAERLRVDEQIRVWFQRALNGVLKSDHEDGVSRAADRAVTVRAWADPRVPSTPTRRRDVHTAAGLARQERLMRDVLRRFEAGAMRDVLPDDFVSSAVSLALSWDAPDPYLQLRVGPFPAGTRLPSHLSIRDGQERVHHFSVDEALTHGVSLHIDPRAFPLRWFVPSADAATRALLAPHTLPRLAFTTPTLFGIETGQGEVIEPPVLRVGRRYVVVAREGTLGAPTSARSTRFNGDWFGYEVNLTDGIPAWVERELSWATLDRAPRGLSIRWHPVELFPSIANAQGRPMRVAESGAPLQVEVAGFEPSDEPQVLLLTSAGMEVLARPAAAPSVVTLPSLQPGRYVVRIASADLERTAADLLLTVYDPRAAVPEIEILLDEPDAAPGIYDLTEDGDDPLAPWIRATPGSSWWLRWEGAEPRNFGLVTADDHGQLARSEAWRALCAHADHDAVGVLHIEAPGVEPLRLRHAWGPAREGRTVEELDLFVRAVREYAAAEGFTPESRARHWFLPLLRLAGWAPRPWQAAVPGAVWQGTIELHHLAHEPSGLVSRPGPRLYVFAPGELETRELVIPLAESLAQRGVAKAFATDGLTWWCVEPTRRQLPHVCLGPDGGDSDRWLEWFGP